MSGCCPDTSSNKAPQPDHNEGCGHSDGKRRFDLLLWGSLLVIVTCYVLHLTGIPLSSRIDRFVSTSFELMNKMWWGLLLAIVFVGALHHIPRDLVISVIGQGNSWKGLFRATAAGVLLDLCSHGILVVGMKLYERGVSLGQVIAFLVASPWNSFSLTLILFALIGLPLTITFVVLSCVVAIFSGFVFQLLVRKQVLMANPNTIEVPLDLSFSQEMKKVWQSNDFHIRNFPGLFWEGLLQSRMVIRWIFFGVVLAGFIRLVMDDVMYGTYFGPSLFGLTMTILGATVIEVCSEGSAPIAADLVNIADAPGNGFTFLMTGVSTDYTEIMSLKETTGSWKIALFLPLITVPQVVFLGYFINLWSLS